MTDSATPIALINGDIAGHGRGVLRILGTRIVSLGGRARRGDLCVDLRGDRILPGLINAHDHLHRNHYGRLKYRDVYQTATQWAADIDAHRPLDVALKSGAAVPKAAAMVMGGIKNLLSGVTTVVHHDTFHQALASPAFPIHVPSRIGWAHSLSIDGEEGVRRSHAATPADAPWFVHAGEGVDAAAAAEAGALAALGVLTGNCVLVHGIAFDAATRARLIERRVGLAWCPGSNQFLFGRCAAAGDMASRGLVAIASDSRLSGERDLLDELRVARRTGEVDDAILESLVTDGAARLLRLRERGTMRAGAIADLLVLPRDARLWDVRRADLRCVLVGGRFRCGDADLADALLEAQQHVPARIDGRPKVLATAVATLLSLASIREPGVELERGAVRAA
jgi:cytosine/adenosine deaminase-related metal-dependent hydrolase